MPEDNRPRRRRRGPPPGGARPQKKPAKGKRKPPAAPNVQMVDVHIRLGLEDHLVRIPVKGWKIILANWMLGQEDIILRGTFGGHEKNIVLRGNSGGSIRVRKPKEGSKVAMFTVIRAVDLRREILESSGV